MLNLGLTGRVLRAVRKGEKPRAPQPLLVELLERYTDRAGWQARSYPFCYRVTAHASVPYYELGCELAQPAVIAMREAVRVVSEGLEPEDVEPLTFGRLVEVLGQRSAEVLASLGAKARVKELSELAAYEAIGLSRVLALAKDERVTEFYVDSESTPVYLDHASAGRCETGIVLTKRECDAIRTHVDTFSGYTLDFQTPSMKNDLQVGGAILRVSLDLEPLAVNRFALDVRRLNVSTLSLPQLIGMGVLSDEAAAVLVGWIEAGGNVTVIGETGTGKTTLLNALDEWVDRRLRRVYIEDAVETRDLLERGYHQAKVKVDPFERGAEAGRTKESEIVKALHRSPDIVVLSEIQSEEHSRAFFQALASGARGMQTFHASTVEQAVRRWVNQHHISEQSLVDLGLVVQMARPDRLKQARHVQRVSMMTQDSGAPRIKELFMRDRSARLRNVAGPGWPAPPEGSDPARLGEKVALAAQRLASGKGP
ncbi:MAG: type II/IV secretion system ATPase subunit [Nitrososphaerota archaeon]|nr:type II/IV secretion system ATPase subunit [Nitrososphaerota archaeon]